MRYIVTPIHITPTKPLNPTHVRHLLYTDALYKGLLLQGYEAIYLYERMGMDVSTQVVKLSKFLQDRQPSDELEVGQEYVRMNREEFELTEEQILAERISLEQTAQGHKYYDAILPSWKKQHEFLNMYTPDLDNSRKFDVSVAEVIEELKKLGVILDGRKEGEKIYLDFTQEGMRLRVLCSGNMLDYNYILEQLREIFGMRREGDVYVFIFDNELQQDYQLICKILELMGHKTVRIETNRILINGSKQSSRNGGWEEFTLQKVLDRYQDLDYTREEISLGLRMYYFVAVPASFDYPTLDKYMKKTKSILGKLTEIPLGQLPHRLAEKWRTPILAIAQAIYSESRYSAEERKSLIHKLFLS